MIIVHLARSETFKCSKDGFFPDKKDCWIYHICVGTTHSVKACKEDLLFNPIKNECDWAMNVRHCQRLPLTITRSLDSRSIAVNDPMTTLCQPPHHRTGCFHPVGGVRRRTTDTLSHAWCRLDYINANPSSAGDSPNKGGKPTSRFPVISDSVFEYLCRSVDSDYVAHPTDCKRYAYCANGKGRDMFTVRFSSSSLARERPVDIESIDQMRIFSISISISLARPSLCRVLSVVHTNN